MLPTQPLPTEDSAGADAARRLLVALGPAYPAPDGSHNAVEAKAMGDALADVIATLDTALDQAFPATATVMLGELETLHGLTVRPDLAIVDRQIRLLAEIRANRGGTPQSILQAVRVIDPTVALFEVTTAMATAAGVPTAVFNFGVLVTAATFANPGLLAAIQSIVAKLSPTHTHGSVGTRAGFLCDDPGSLCDRDLLGE